MAAGRTVQPARRVVRYVTAAEGSSTVVGAGGNVVFGSGTAAGTSTVIGQSGGSVGSPATITTITFDDTSGSGVSSGWIPKVFGHVFKKGDIAPGDHPIFKTAGNVVIGYTEFGKTTWSDGSYKFASFQLSSAPVAISPGGSAVITMFSGGAAQSPATRTIADLTAQDMKMVLTGIDNLTAGPWTSSLNQGVTDADDHLIIGTGRGGLIGRTRQQYRSGGAGTDHGQAECYFYWQIVQKSDLGLGFFRLLPQSAQPWLDIDSPAKLKRDFSAAFQNGASTSGLTQPSSGTAKTYTASGQTMTTATASGYSRGCPVRLTTSGTLPAPFQLSTTYYVRPLTPLPSATTFALYSTQGGAVSGGSAITATDTGTGTHTVTPHLEMQHFTSFFAANTDGTWQFVQGGGSVTAEATVRVRFNQAYWRSTRLIPPYDTSVTPVAMATQNYVPFGHANLRFDQNGTGEDETIGEQPNWVAGHFLLQDAVQERLVRVNALSMGHPAINLRRNSTKTIPVVNNTNTYTGMGAAAPTMRWSITNVSGFTGPTPSSDRSGTIIATDSAHWPHAIYYAYLITGEPQYADLLAAEANFMIVNRAADSSRNPTVGVTPYYGCCFRDPYQARTDAWGSLALALAAGIMPDAHWENAYIKTYLGDMVQAGYASINAYNAAQSTFWQNSGMYLFRTSDAALAPWQHHFMISCTSFSHTVTENAAALTLLNHLVKFPVAVDSDFDVYNMTGFSMRGRTADGQSGPYVTAMNQIYYCPGGGATSTMIASTDVITSVISGSKFTLTAGDGAIYTKGSDTGPTGKIAAQTPYIIIGTTLTDGGPRSNKTFKVALPASPTTPVDILADGPLPGVNYLSFRMQTLPTSPTSLDYQGSSYGYTAIARAAYRWAEAAGATGMGSVRAKMDTYWTNSAGNFNNAKNAMQATF